MRINNVVLFSVITVFALIGCGSGPSSSSAPDELDTAIRDTSDYLNKNIPAGNKIVILNIESNSHALSDYIIDELIANAVNDRAFSVVDRHQLDLIREEQDFILSGEVEDTAALEIGRFLGANTIVSGAVSEFGNGYRMRIRALDVQTARVQGQFNRNIAAGSTVTMLMKSIDTVRLAASPNISAETEVDRAVTAMARNVDKMTIIAVGRISYANTQSVSGFSAWLKNSIIASANKQDKFQVASEIESANFAVASRGLTVDAASVNSNIEAVVVGSFSPLDSGAEVMLQMVSTTGNKVVLASSSFVISASELERRRLSLLPEMNNTVISRVDFETRQQAISPYSGSNNRWTFTITPDVLDGIYYDGDYMTMRVYSQRDCYFRIIHVDVNGNTQVIYPLSARDNNFIRAGETRRIPDNTRYRMGQPFGEELILGAAYERPFSQGQQSGTLSAESISRGIVVEDNNHANMNPSATARFSYTILPR
jgi:TolB-like protein